MDSRVSLSDVMERGLSLFQRNGGTGNQREVYDEQNYRITSIAANPTAVWSLDYSPLQWPRCVNDGIFFPGQSKTKGEQKNHKDFHSTKIRKRMGRERRKKEKKHSWSNVLRESSLPWCQLFLFLFNLIFRPPGFTQDQVSGKAFFSCGICTPILTLYNLAAVSMVKTTWSCPFRKCYFCKSIKQ